MLACIQVGIVCLESIFSWRYWMIWGMMLKLQDLWILSEHVFVVLKWELRSVSMSFQETSSSTLSFSISSSPKGHQYVCQYMLNMSPVQTLAANASDIRVFFKRNTYFIKGGAYFGENIHTSCAFWKYLVDLQDTRNQNCSSLLC